MTTGKSAIFNPTDLVLELDQTTIDRAWSSSQTAGNPTSRWQNYLNQMALAVFLPWLKTEEDATAKALGQNQAAVWELVNTSLYREAIAWIKGHLENSKKSRGDIW